MNIYKHFNTLVSKKNPPAKYADGFAKINYPYVGLKMYN